jgi:hypothetical protein
VHWLRLLQAEAAATAALARETATAPPSLPIRLDVIGAAILDLERRFLSGELAWSVGP